MSTLSSANTNQNVWASYDDNASYEEDGSIIKAAAFITACRILLQRRPKRAGFGRGNAEQEFDPSVYERQIEKAEAWKAGAATGPANPSGPGGVIHAGFENFRD